MNVEEARRVVNALIAFFEDLRDDEDPGEEGLSVTDIDKTLDALSLIRVLLR